MRHGTDWSSSALAGASLILISSLISRLSSLLQASRCLVSPSLAGCPLSTSAKSEVHCVQQQHSDYCVMRTIHGIVRTAGARCYKTVCLATGVANDVWVRRTAGVAASSQRPAATPNKCDFCGPQILVHTGRLSILPSLSPRPVQYNTGATVRDWQRSVARPVDKVPMPAGCQGCEISQPDPLPVLSPSANKPSTQTAFL